MGNQETFPRTEVACAMTRDLNVDRSTPNVQLTASELGVESWRFSVDRLLLRSVPGRGLEPLRISPPDPKSGASANFATLASLIYKDLQTNQATNLLPVQEVVL